MTLRVLATVAVVVVVGDAHTQALGHAQQRPAVQRRDGRAEEEVWRLWVVELMLSLILYSILLEEVGVRSPSFLF